MKYLYPLYFFLFCNVLNAAQDVQTQLTFFKLCRKDECNPNSIPFFPTFQKSLIEASAHEPSIIKPSIIKDVLELSLIYDKYNERIYIKGIRNNYSLDCVGISSDKFEEVLDLKYHNKKSIRESLISANDIYCIDKDYYLCLRYILSPQCHAIAHISQIEFKKNDKLPEPKQDIPPISSPEGSRMSSPELFFRVALSAAIIAGFFYSCYFLGHDLMPAVAKKLCGK